MYKKVIKPILFKFGPEGVHNFMVATGEFFGSFSLGRFLLSWVYGYRGPDISKTVDGVHYKTPILLSAGFDYNAHLTQVLSSLSFGGEEIGSVTAKPCGGNSKPRLTRLPFSKSILVNKGLRNDGVDIVLARLAMKKKIKDFVLGLSIARTNEKEASTVEAGIADYVYSLKKVVESGLGDYYTINISCPNTFNGEPFTTAELLEKLFIEIDKVPRLKPLYVKMPLNVSDNVFVQLLGVLDRHNAQGVIVGNLQKDYSYIDKRDFVPTKYSGGLSGKPCFERSNELITLTKQEYKDRFTVIGCGGVFSYEDAKVKFDLGADLIHMITGMIYEGPGLIKKICQGIALQKEGK
jgi:dihydroorotate dehydrogenase